ncbi:uncharacterized protein LOC115770836 [Drosophila novamexicana]|uniref:uncharacterized protein LOC115770836 n=1 Tax=Drosophila novamexicana TaxID=47314 RepID=UPI0011E5B8E8|nr:uncharacterized protein LOC115770836 [Drosophila novamexicana]
MESKLLNIMDLNDDCLGCILKYLDIEDHVNFGETCSRFREILGEWINVLYPEFEIKKCYGLHEIEWELKLFFTVSGAIRRMKFVIGQPVAFPVNRFCNHVKSMDSLEYFSLYVGNDDVWQFGVIDKVLSALTNLPKLKSLIFSCGTQRFDVCKLIRFNCLKELKLFYGIAVKDLVAICKSNANLRILNISMGNGELNGIVPHCQNLEEICFPISCSSYAGLAELPHIRKVVIYSGSSTSPPWAKLMEFFSAFVAQQQKTQLESLILYPRINFEVTTKLIELKFLKELRCSFEDASCIDLLANLTELESLYFLLRNGPWGNECLNVLRSCKKLQRLQTNCKLSAQFIDDVLDVLRQVRNIKIQKPLELCSWQPSNAEEEKLANNAYCILMNPAYHHHWLS